LEPEANFTTSGHVYYLANEGYVDPHKAVRTLGQGAIDQGVSFVGDELVAGLARNDEGVKISNNDRKTEQFADMVIITAGVNATGKVLGGLPLVSSPWRISFAHPQSSSLSPPPASISRILVDVIQESHVLQQKDGTFAVGGGALEVGGSSASN
jgi:glycine/D-amino acid oxidase-like deaminating enzyme